MKYLTVKEKAEELRVSVYTLYRMVERKQIEHYRFGRKCIRFKPGDNEKNRVEPLIHRWKKL